MQKVKKLFGEFKMTWPRVLIFAVITAIMTALLNEIPFLRDTSFQDIAIVFDCWILFAVFIIMNCEKWWEASLKCFVFFLVSQPLIYLMEVPFEPNGWDVFRYYVFWIKPTLYTLPGAAIAFFVKRKNWLSVLILSVANAYLAFMCVSHFRNMTASFPHHLLSAVFCLGLAVFFTSVLLEDKKHRTLALIIIAAVLISSLIITKPIREIKFTIGDGDWTCIETTGEFVDVAMEDGAVTLKAKGKGTEILTFQSSSGEIKEYWITVTGHEILADEID